MTEIIDPPQGGEIIPGPTQQQWKGDSPFFLVIELASGPGNVGIDLDEAGWLETNKDYLREPGVWFLIDKQSQQPAVAVVVAEGDQPYFTKHHVGNLMAGTEILAYGMGKKCADGTMVRNWLLPGGLVVGGDDVDIIASRMLGQ